MSNAPLILADNLYENVILHPTYVLANRASDDAAGHEAFRVADNLRDMTWWTRTGTGASSLAVDCVTPQQPSMVVLDRGHNLVGASLTLAGYTDTTYTTLVGSMTATVPAVTGGRPGEANGCLTAEGVWWKTFALPAARVWQVTVTPASGAPIVTGLYLGAAYRFPAYFNAPFGSDYATDVKLIGNQLSRGGVRAVARRLNLRRFVLNVDFEHDDYPAFDPQLRQLLRYGQPWWICLDDDDATQAGLLAPFQLAQDTTFDPSMNPYHREIRNLVLEEAVPVLW